MLYIYTDFIYTFTYHRRTFFLLVVRVTDALYHLLETFIKGGIFYSFLQFFLTHLL